MLIQIDSASSVPVYEQLREQMVRLISAGHLAAGTRLPAIRQLAADLGIAPGTVSRAYTELEREGLLRTRRPQGTFVAAGAAGRRTSALLQRMADHFVEQAQQLGIDRDEAVEALRASYARSTPAAGTAGG